MQALKNRLQMELTSGGLRKTSVLLFDQMVTNGMDSPISPSISFVEFEQLEEEKDGFIARFKKDIKVLRLNETGSNLVTEKIRTFYTTQDRILVASERKETQFKDKLCLSRLQINHASSSLESLGAEQTICSATQNPRFFGVANGTYIFEVTAEGSVIKYDLNWKENMAGQRLLTLDSYSKTETEITNIRRINSGNSMIIVHMAKGNRAADTAS